MDYFSILNLNKEPFSNSPDPDYFFNSQQHVDCLQKLELSLRLKRGLNVVIGEVGTGKTTLCRQLLRRFSEDSDIETHLILDPHFSTPHEFLLAVTEMLTNEKFPGDIDDYKLKEQIKQVLFSKGVDENKIIILIIDEGQKIPVFCLEILRELLNFETNDYKLLQIAIFAQTEFNATLEEHANFADRISLYHMLRPMNFRDTRAMIQYRLNQSSGAAKRMALFTYPALWAIYRATKGYPRKIVNLCHRSILTMIIQNKSKANWFLVQSCIRRVFSADRRWSWQLALVLLIVLIGAAITIPRWLNDQQAAPVAKETETPAQPITAESDRPQQIRVIATTKDKNTSVSSYTTSPEPNVDAAAVLSAAPTPETASKDHLSDSPDPLPAATETTTQGEHQVPGVLGHLKIKRHETLGGLIQTIYGVFNVAYLQSVVGINPHIINPDTINVGDSIVFPAVPAHVAQQPLKRWWIEIADEDSLEKVFQILRRYPGGAPPSRLIPYWNRTSGLRFKVILRQLFYNEAAAASKVASFQLPSGTKGTIVSEWGDHTVFYANPYQSAST